MKRRETLWMRTKAHAHLRASLMNLSGAQSDLKITDPDMHHRVALVFRELEESAQELRIRATGDKSQEPEKITRPAPEGCDPEVWARWRFLIPAEIPDLAAKMTVERFEDLRVQTVETAKMVAGVKERGK